MKFAVTPTQMLLAAALVAVAISPMVSAGEADDRIAYYARLDNDAVAGSDQGYSSGAEFGLITPTISDFQDPRLSPLVRTINRQLAWLQPRGFEDNNVVFTMGHGIFTPQDWRLREPDPRDRPYAGVLVLGVNYNGRNGDVMHATTLNVGLVGPSAGAEQLQDFVHDFTGGKRFQGWDHQLQDEPVFRILHQRLHKWIVANSIWKTDVIVHGGGSVGNLATFANFGAELRFGPSLPDNFGSAPALPVSENTAPLRGARFAEELQVHGFITADARYVFHDITLDGNTWKDSASVERRDMVADLGVGVAALWRGWKIGVAHYFRTKEFSRQGSEAQLASITIRRDM